MTAPEAQGRPTDTNNATTADKDATNGGPPTTASAETAGESAAAGVVPSHQPILDERHVGRIDLLFQRPPAQVHVSRICVQANGSQLHFAPDKQPTVGELFWGHVRTIYDVDLRLHCTDLNVELPSALDLFSFQAEIDLHWKVVEPDVVVRLGIADVRRTLAPVLFSHLRKVTRQYEIQDAELAEEAANKELCGSDVGAEFGLDVRPFVRLRMDQDNIEFAARKRRIEHFDAIIEAGEFSQFALLLAEDPKQVFDMIKTLSGERVTRQRTMLSFINGLLDSEALDRWQIDDDVRATLQWVRTTVQEALPTGIEIKPISYGQNPQIASRPNAGGS
jgi:hypothetical protein